MSFEIALMVLAGIVTFFGFSLAVLAIFFIIRGTSQVQSGKPHTIKYDKFEFQTDRVVLLLIVCVIATVLPFALVIWLKSQGPQTLDLEHLELNLAATIEEAPGRPARGVSVNFKRRHDGKDEILCPDLKIGNGSFSCSSPLKSLNDKFELRVMKEGYRDEVKRFMATDQDYFITLQRSR